MKAWLIFRACFSPALAQQGPLHFGGTIAGSVRGDDGTMIAGAYLSLQLEPPYVKSRHLETEWTLQSGSDGSFQFTGLNDGTYRICGYVPHGTRLNPCTWGLEPPTVTLSNTQPASTITLTLKQGAVVPIRINDLGQLLPLSTFMTLPTTTRTICTATETLGITGARGSTHRRKKCRQDCTSA